MLKFKLVASKAYTKAREAYTLAKTGQIPEIDDMEVVDYVLDLLERDGVTDAEFIGGCGTKVKTRELVADLRQRGLNLLP